MGNELSQDDLNALFGDIESEKNTSKEIKTGDALLQEDMNDLLDNIWSEIKKPEEPMEAKNAETTEGSETLTQDQIDELLKAMLDN